MGTTVEAAYEEGFLDSEVMFHGVFFPGCCRAERFRALNGAIAMLHMLGQAGVGPFAHFSSFHVLFVSDLKATCCFADIGFLTRSTVVFVDAFALKRVPFGLVFGTENVLEFLTGGDICVASCFL